MPSTSETGHAKNVANFEDLISFCVGYADKYQPSKENLKVENMQTLRTDALTSLELVKTSKTFFDNSVNARQELFKPFRPFITRVMNALAASDVSKLLIADAKTINNKIQGARAKPVNTPPPADAAAQNTPTAKTISASQQSMDSLIDHFKKLIQLLTQESKYSPNEADLKVIALTTLLNNMTVANSTVIDAVTTWSNVRIDRDNLLYNPKTGLVQTASDAKKIYQKYLWCLQSTIQAGNRPRV